MSLFDLLDTQLAERGGHWFLLGVILGVLLGVILGVILGVLLGVILGVLLRPVCVFPVKIQRELSGYLLEKQIPLYEMNDGDEQPRKSEQTGRPGRPQIGRRAASVRRPAATRADSRDVEPINTGDMSARRSQQLRGA